MVVPVFADTMYLKTHHVFPLLPFVPTGERTGLCQKAVPPETTLGKTLVPVEEQSIHCTRT